MGFWDDDPHPQTSRMSRRKKVLEKKSSGKKSSGKKSSEKKSSGKVNLSKFATKLANINELGVAHFILKLLDKNDEDSKEIESSLFLLVRGNFK